MGLSTPSYVDTERGRVTLSRLLRSTPQREERIAYLAVRSEGRDVGTVAVRPGHGPLWARIPQGHLELPSFHQVHPQFRTEARWQHTEAFLAALADVSLRPVGHPAVGKRRAGPDHQRPHLTNETIALSVDLPAPAAACVTRQHIERAFLEAWPQAEHSSLCAIRYHLDQRNLTVQLALASVLPGHNPFLGQARKDRFRQNLLGLLQPLAATATLSPGTRELPAERTLARA